MNTPDMPRNVTDTDSLVGQVVSQAFAWEVGEGEKEGLEPE